MSAQNDHHKHEDESAKLQGLSIPRGHEAQIKSPGSEIENDSAALTHRLHV